MTMTNEEKLLPGTLACLRRDYGDKIAVRIVHPDLGTHQGLPMERVVVWYAAGVVCLVINSWRFGLSSTRWVCLLFADASLGWVFLTDLEPL